MSDLEKKLYVKELLTQQKEIRKQIKHVEFI